MKVVDEQTRQVVRQTRIDALEEDNLFSIEYSPPLSQGSTFDKPDCDDFLLDSENEDLFSIGINPRKKKKMGKGDKASGKSGKEAPGSKPPKLTHRPKLNILKILSPEFYDMKSKMPHYLNMRAAPSATPPHKYCSVCVRTSLRCPTFF